VLHPLLVVELAVPRRAAPLATSVEQWSGADEYNTTPARAKGRHSAADHDQRGETHERQSFRIETAGLDVGSDDRSGTEP
jgi:hypothetical protein